MGWVIKGWCGKNKPLMSRSQREIEAGRMIETGLTDQIENRGRKKRREGIRMGEGVQDAEGREITIRGFFAAKNS